MTRRAARSLVVGTITCLALAGFLPPAEAATYGGIQAAGAPYSWNPGKALAATDRFLLSAWASDCPPPTGACARNTRPKMGVYVQRSAVDARPAAWKTPLRVSPPKLQAERAALGADGSLAAVGWVTQTSYLHYRPSARRIFWLRVSVDGGRTWRPAVQMTVTAGRVDYPRIAVSEGQIYAVWTNAATGEIRLAISANAGATWTKQTVGTSSAHADGSAEGFAALPDVGASGQNVAVVWFADDGGAVNQVGSTNGGAGWTSPTQLTDSSTGLGRNYPAAQGATDGVTHRVAIAYGTDRRDRRADLRRRRSAGAAGARAVVARGGLRDDLHRRLRSGDRAVRLLGTARGVRRVSRRERPLGSLRHDLGRGARRRRGGRLERRRRGLVPAGASHERGDPPVPGQRRAVARAQRRRAAHRFDRYQSTFAAYRVGMRSGS